MKILTFLFASSLLAQTPLAIWIPTAGTGSTLADTSGSHYDIALNSGPVWLWGGALDFNGSSQYGSIPNGAIAFGASDFAIIGVIQPDIVDGPGTNVTIMSGADSGDATGWQMRINATCSAKLEWYTPAGGWKCSVASLTSGAWTTFAVTQTGTTLKFFINGALDSTFTGYAKPTAYASPGALASASGGASRWCACQIGYLATYTGTMSDATAIADSSALVSRVSAVTITKSTPSMSFPTGIGVTNNSGTVTGVTFTAGQMGNLIDVGGTTYTIASTTTITPAFSGTTGSYAYLIYTPVARASIPNPLCGWASWYYSLTFGTASGKVTDAQIRQQANAMIATGFLARGCNYLFIEEPGMVGRDGSGNLVSHRFAALSSTVSYLHNLGIKVGIYTSPSTTTCKGYYGSFGWEQIDAATFLAAGLDLLEYDTCYLSTSYASQISALGSNTVAVAWYVYQYMAQAVKSTWGSNVPLFALTAAISSNQLWVNYAGWNTWRFTGDVGVTFAGWASLVPGATSYATGCTSTNAPSYCFGDSYTGLGLYNYADNVAAGDGMTCAQGQTVLSVDAMLMSPIFASTDMQPSVATNCTLNTFTNSEVMAVALDSANLQGAAKSTSTCGAGSCQVWIRKLTGTDTYAILLSNTDTASHSITANFSSLGISSTYSYCRDLWAHNYVGAQDTTTPGGGWGSLSTSYTATVPASGSVMIWCSNTKPAKPGAALF